MVVDLTKWEIFMDVSYYDLWCVRPIGDLSFNSQYAVHYCNYEEALDFKKMMEEKFRKERKKGKKNDEA